MERYDAIRTLIAVEVGKHKHGVFVTSLARAWVVADSKNKGFTQRAWSLAINRYALKEVYSKEIEEHLPEYLEAEAE